MIATPLTTLTKKNQKFEWTQKCEEAYMKLKEKLTNAPILVLPDQNKAFTVYTDASGSGLGCVLMQDSQVIAYGS